jgi:PEGA domain-containing protein
VRKIFALVLLGSALSACSAIPASDAGSRVSLESNPPGAHVSLSSFGSCTTPCTLPAPDTPGNYSVTFGLTGYAPVTLPIHATVIRQGWYSSETAVEPNPVMAVLQPTTTSAHAKQN